MLLDEYNKAIDQLIKKVRTTQKDNIDKAAQMITDTITNGGKIYLGEICHSIQMDIINRGGGPVFYKKFEYPKKYKFFNKPFFYKFFIRNTKVDRKNKETDASGLSKATWGMAKYALKWAGLKKGDLLMLSSVSGRTVSVVDLAYEAKKMGIKVIAFTSMEYTKTVDPVHPCGKRLYEMVDLAMDNCAPAAEAMIEYPGIEARYAAASGIACNILLWSMTSVAVDMLMAKGITPGILKSANYPGGMNYNNTVIYPTYEKHGY